MRNTKIRTSVTFTTIEGIGFNTNTNQLEEISVDIPATAKTEKGIEKLLQDNVDENIKVVKIVRYDKYQIWYEMDRDTFMTWAKVIDK